MGTISSTIRLQNLHILIEELIQENISLKEAVGNEIEKNQLLNQKLKKLEMDLRSEIKQKENEIKSKHAVSNLLQQASETDIVVDSEKEKFILECDRQIKNIDLCISYLEKNFNSI